MRSLGLILCLTMLSATLLAEDARFIRGINLNGPALRVDGHPWEASATAINFKAVGKFFENQKVILKPQTDEARTRMIRSSIWGSEVEIELTNLPAAAYQVFLYVWEDNFDETMDLLVNGEPVQQKFHSGSAGTWKRLGPWRATSKAGKLSISAKGASHGAANLSGLELWTDGTIDGNPKVRFADNATAEQIAFFESKIRPVLVEHCYECHSSNAQKLKGGLLLDSRAGVHQGGDTGALLTPGDPDASLLIQALRHRSEDIAMPPKKLLPRQIIADFETWVRMGAPDPRLADTVAALKAKESIDWSKARDWWSFHPLSSPPIPSVKDRSWPKNDIDRFVLAKLEAVDLKPGDDADKRALIRRATYDLTGLPPTPEEVASFINDSSADAFARVIDRLLASPAYGERWGRHWLDVVRYADTAGDNSDYPIPQMSDYRDWVIDALNRDLPYDDFVRDQLAGDLRGGTTDTERYARTKATGYLANSRRFGSRIEDYPQHLTIEDTIDNLGRSFMGLTINCARCHDHKFDPITAKDYYALYGIFNSTRYPWPGIELSQKQRDLVPLVPAGQLESADIARKEREQEIARFDKEIQRLKEAATKASGKAKQKCEEQTKAMEAAAIDYQTRALPFELAYAVTESATIADVPLQQKGDPAKPGENVRRRFLTVFGGAELPADTKSSGRAQLAEWILAGNNPLPARVMANRVWQHHFGRGIVPTPNDFGKQGKPPTHPELLDYLATSFREHGWSLKGLHRTIMLSRTYQLASTRAPAALARDPSNELLSSYPRLRLDAESIRDTLLTLGENMDRTVPGRHPFPPQHDWNFTQHNPFKTTYESKHRSVYLMTQRIQRHPYLAIFDGADPSTSTPARPTSTTPLQALYFLNDSFFHEQSKLVAQRVCAHSSEITARIQHAHELLFSRPAMGDEISAAVDFMREVRTQLPGNGIPDNEIETEVWCSYVRVLFRLNEFVYLD